MRTRKPRCNSSWRKLNRRQRATMETWLFDDHLGYDETLGRVRDQFGLKATRSSLSRYYLRRLHERQADDLLDAQAMVETVAAPEADPNAMRVAAMKLITKTALKIAFERPDRLKDLASLTKLILMNEDMEIRRSRVKLQQQQFHYETASAASKELPNLARLLLSIEEDDSLTDEGKLQRIHDLLYPDRARMGLHTFPEDDEEEEPGDEADEDEYEEDEEEEEELKEEEEKIPAVPVPADPPPPESAPKVELPEETTPAVASPPEENPPPVPELMSAEELKRRTILAEEGGPTHAEWLGVHYRDGHGVPQDLNQARHWLAKAAAGGIPNAKIALLALRIRHPELDWEQ